MFIKVVSIIVTCFAVCLNSFSENEVSYDFAKATETGKITLGKLAVTINSAGIVSIKSGDKVLTENINCYFTGLDWKLIWDPLRISGERSIELLETNGCKYFISTQVSPSDFPAIKVKTRIELSKTGIFSVLYNFEQPDGTAILNNCVVFIGNYYDKIYCTDIKGQEREIISLPGSVTAPKEIKISTGNQHWTVTNDVLKNWSAVVIGDKKG